MSEHERERRAAVIYAAEGLAALARHATLPAGSLGLIIKRVIAEVDALHAAIAAQRIDADE